MGAWELVRFVCTTSVCFTYAWFLHVYTSTHTHTQAKDAAEAKATYGKAKEALAAYLKGTKLEPLGDPIYNQ